ncbi:unnamed protein product [Penicillium salamii]|uniref:C2H2-type domain-containing protein n=1 Tax=Penicillium salamii TaxID=1612424 RepID=A0A9W4N6M3_9EURO|nr:unnamed protein product [Penicillium salamii]
MSCMESYRSTTLGEIRCCFSPADIVPLWFQCEYPDCNAKYRCKEHLNRHRHHHDTDINIACPNCESVLTRNDLLRRHIRTHHSQREPPPSRRFRACSAYHARKVRCEGVLQCNACDHRGIVCVPARGETTSEKQFWIDNLYLLPPVSTVNDAVPDKSCTFDFVKEPCVLVESIIAIRLWVKGTQESETHQYVCITDFFPYFMLKWCKTLLLNDKYDLLASLVQSCRYWCIFSYFNMLLQHDADALLALVYISVEEIKIFGLALYKVCRLSTPASFDLAGECSNSGRKELLSLSDLSFYMPDSDELWNALLGAESEVLSKSGSSAVARDDGNSKN